MRGLDDGLRRWWASLQRSPVYACDGELLALGGPALQRLLDCIDGKAVLDVDQTYTQARDWGDWRILGVGVFAKADLARVLDAVQARGWSDVKIAACVGRVPDPRVVPYLLARLAEKEPLDRAAAVNDLAVQHCGTALRSCVTSRSNASARSAIHWPSSPSRL